MLEVKGLDVRYGKAQVLFGVSLDVSKEEIVALVGANGAGKTTLLNTISGVVQPAAGTVSFAGQRTDGLTPPAIVDLGICHIPESRRLFVDMTVRENLEMGAYPRRAWRSKDESVRRAFELFPVLKERAGQLARTLSGGEQQMLAMARGLMSRPRLCLIDEPSYGLSPVLVSQVFEVIKSLPSQGVGVLLIEQNVRRSLEIADRGYVLENGTVCLEGACADLLSSEHVRKAYLGL